jgi:transposase
MSQKTYLPYTPKQSELFPPSPLDWLPQDHLAYFILDVVAQLDLGPIYAYYERERRGFPPYHPQMMVGLLLYAYCVGVPASRKIERRTHEDVAFRVITGGQHPDHSCISEFRRRHSAQLQSLFVQVLALCMKAGLVKLGHVALDGTKVKASASKHKAMSYERMKQKEAELREKVRALLQSAEDEDAAEDARYGKNKRGDELPEELRDAKSRLARIQALKAELEAEARRQAEEEAKQQERSKRDDDDPKPPAASAELPSHRIPRTEEGNPTDKAQRSFTDADSRIMKTGDGYLQGYNCQAAVDSESQVIVAHAVTNQPPDVEHLVPMLGRIIENCGAAPQRLSADAGYFSEENVQAALEHGVDPFIATGRAKHGTTLPKVRGRPRSGMALRECMARRLATKRGAVIYARRKVIVEPVFGQMKGARGLRQFLTRGLEKVRAEWALWCATHNLLKLYKAGIA